MERTTVYLPSDLKAALARTARDHGRKEADLIREGIRSVVNASFTPQPRLPLFASGKTDLAESVDEAMKGFGDR
jgi:hypothetical protein